MENMKTLGIACITFSAIAIASLSLPRWPRLCRPVAPPRPTLLRGCATVATTSS
jgi:hypothetical protein